tara:strand:+ start:232 stop:438 length:207 start_codon:yes stop_codon:yes gene_type:complete
MKGNMELLKQKLKTKKYQYLYLLHKLYEKMERINWYEDMCGEYNEEESNRVSFYIKWLDKINKKYNYV